MYPIKQVLPTLTATVAGASFGPVFRRHEPTLKQFFSFAAVVGAANASYFMYARVGDPVVQALSAFAAFMIGLAASILHYRLVSASHPLHHVPGPVIAAATKWWLFAQITSGRSREAMEKVHSIYGPVVRIAPNELSVVDIDAILQIHGAKSWIRGTSYSVSFHSSGGMDSNDVSMLNLISHAAHTPRRRMWDRAFTIQSLKDYEPLVLERISELIVQMDRLKGTKIDMNKWLGYLVFDVTSDVAYGGGSTFLKSGSDPTDCSEGVVAAMRLQGRLMALPWLAPILKHSPLAAKAGGFAAFCKAQFDVRHKNGNPRGGVDFLTHLIDAGGGLSTVALAGEASLLMAHAFAGADTTRVAISIILMFLLRDQPLHKRLRASIDKALEGAEMVEIDGQSFPPHDVVKAIPLLDACINEGLRIAPPLSVEPMRQAPPEGAVICGVPIPGGAQVRILTSTIQRSPDNFVDPLKFRPERWLKPEQGGSEGLFDKRAFFPFLFGPYHCVGKQFAYQEMRLFIATLLWKYDLAFAPGFSSAAFLAAVEENGTILELTKPLELVFSRRAGH